MFHTRFAPSPTGFLHIGSMRTALFSWLLAKHYNGKCALRIEDTDKERSTAEYVDLIFQGLNWLGLEFDGPVIYQSQREQRYQEVIDQLLQEGKAYYCTCSAERLESLRAQQQKDQVALWHYDRHCRGRTERPQEPAVVRLMVPDNGNVQAVDHIQGTIAQAWEAIDDWIIQRSDGSATYNFAVVVDDHDQQITHVVRGADHSANTPKQVALYELLGWDVPEFCHLPLILDDQGAKMSKRKKSANVLQYRDEGFLPEALVNAIARLGWSHGDQEIFQLEELITHFSLESLNKAPSMFNEEKFHWIAKQHFGALSTENFAQRSQPFFPHLNEEQRQQRGLLTIGRAESFSDALKQTDFIENPPAITPSQLKQQYPQLSSEILSALIAELETKSDPAELFSAIKQIAKAHGLGVKDLAFPVRTLITGTEQSPDLKNIAIVLGLPEVISRLQAGLE